MTREEKERERERRDREMQDERRARRDNVSTAKRTDANASVPAEEPSSCPRR
jgi:hypothetical protein